MTTAVEKVDNNSKIMEEAHRHHGGGFSKPSWLLSAVTALIIRNLFLVMEDMDMRMKKLVANSVVDDENEGDTFAQRAESYYHKRPQLLALLQDIYNAYLSLVDRYSQTLAKNHHRHRSVDSFLDDGGDGGSLSDAESSLSYQNPPLLPGALLNQMQAKTEVDGDVIVTELVMKSVEFDILQHEFHEMDRQCSGESYMKKIELQKSLLEVLESERLILLNENARLGYKISTLMEENKGLAAESMFMKRKANELARCILKMREDQRVSILSRRIEDLQGQIYGLEKRNREYYEQLVKRDQVIEQRFTVENLINSKTKKSNTPKRNNGYGEGSSGKNQRKSSLWNRFKSFDLFACVPHPASIA